MGGGGRAVWGVGGRSGGVVIVEGAVCEAPVHITPNNKNNDAQPRIVHNAVSSHTPLCRFPNLRPYANTPPITRRLKIAYQQLGIVVPGGRCPVWCPVMVPGVVPGGRCPVFVKGEML